MVVTGPKAVLLLALTLGLRVRAAWLERYALVGLTLDDMRSELRRTQTGAPQPHLGGIPLR